MLGLMGRMKSVGTLSRHFTKKLDPDRVNLKHFETQRLIGMGGFGKVHAAKKKTQPGKGQLYAIKQLSQERLLEMVNGFDNLLREKEFLSMLKHPFICNLYYSFLDRVNCYLVMDIALGGDLRHRLKSGAPNALLRGSYDPKRPVLSENELKFDMRCVALALQYIHENGVIHRDIKPDNLLLEENGYVLLNDFGLAERLVDKGCKRVSGTKKYKAPEVAAGSTHSYAADIFALGVSMYELTAGCVPFQKEQLIKGRDMSEADVTALLREALEKLDILGVSKELLNVLEKMLQFDQERRIGYSSGAGELLGDPWFQYDDWESFTAKKLTAPFFPDTNVANIDEEVIYADVLETFNPVGKSRNITLPIDIEGKLETYPYDYRRDNGEDDVLKVY
eukprot:CAMPEP_0204871124 /NCGR_PEP_ID=MMETSP1348-20121228/34428_1 /ASSEMBLY_ACC=CAM_ASM_000700 /TAXON_ID=215587 /ORGANISM="Aplanochytrium stocchinoi, Strain GSBS06" /LENGTH=391 /DNA_ID=CAMNT_0052025261 /DNA_START=143 /DNA_END=1318 /DNA_ORIENTATION=-